MGSKSVQVKKGASYWEQVEMGKGNLSLHSEDVALSVAVRQEVPEPQGPGLSFCEMDIMTYPALPCPALPPHGFAWESKA
jgi:hypothetical protein